MWVITVLSSLLGRLTMATDTVLVPRLGVTVERKVVDRAIVESIRDLGYEKPRQYQADVLFKFVSGRDTFVSMPTGSGKSLCFASTPIVFDKLKGYCTNPPSSVSTHHCITRCQKSADISNLLLLKRLIRSCTWTMAKS